jgi:flavin-dependent dehydrogenase
VSLASLEREGSSWVVNGNIRARLVVGAGGHFCPVARHFSPKAAATAVVAQETEFEMDAHQLADCPVRGYTPELYFCPDMKGYGWCFRKGNILNIGLGRADSRGLPDHVGGFVHFLKSRGVSHEMPALRGHAYFL